MIGNDVIDLALATTQSNWKRNGYLDKIFTNLEQQLIFKNSNQDEMVWSLWSRKEAVYKVLIQKGMQKGYYPIKIECINADYENGMVNFGNQIYYTKTIISDDSIHSLALENSDFFDNIKKIQYYKKLKIINGIPFYELNSKLLSASKSHHGRFEEIVYLQS